MAGEYGPFASEEDARSTRAAAALRAACDANPGAWQAEHLRVMTSACEEAGVELGAFDMVPFRQLAMYEPFNAVVMAAVIRRVLEAGKAAALDGAVTEWGLRYQSGDEDDVVMPYPEDEVRRIQRESGDISPAVRRTAITRQVGPWTPVPGEEGGSA